MPAREGPPRFDLEECSYLFALRIRKFVRQLPRTICHQEDVRQLVRSSGSIGANYIEANETVGQKDFRYRLRIARKEAKESRHWLRLLDTSHSSELDLEREALIQESVELMLILTAILKKTES